MREQTGVTGFSGCRKCGGWGWGCRTLGDEAADLGSGLYCGGWPKTWGELVVMVICWAVLGMLGLAMVAMLVVGFVRGG